MWKNWRGSARLQWPISSARRRRRRGRFASGRGASCGQRTRARGDHSRLGAGRVCVAGGGCGHDCVRRDSPLSAIDRGGARGLAGAGNDWWSSGGHTAGARPRLRGLRDGAGDVSDARGGVAGGARSDRHQRGGRDTRGHCAGIAGGDQRPHQSDRDQRRAGAERAEICMRAGSGRAILRYDRAYSPRLRRLAHAEAERQKIPLSEGVYLAVLGPSYETPARFARSARGRGPGGDVHGA